MIITLNMPCVPSTLMIITLPTALKDVLLVMDEQFVLIIIVIIDIVGVYPVF